MSRLLRLASAATVVAAVAAPAPALAAWTPPTAVGTAADANPSAQGAFGGSILTGWLEPTVSLAKRSGDGFGSPAALNAADPFEKAWASALDKDGNAIVLTVRKHKPLQRIRAIFVAADGTRSATRTISDNTHSAAGPVLSVAPDGTAVAAWAWHDPAGWRAQVAIRRPGQARFDRPQTVSPPAPKVGRSQTRPRFEVAAGDGGRAVMTWQIGGNPAAARVPAARPHRRARRGLRRRSGTRRRGRARRRRPGRRRRPARSRSPTSTSTSPATRDRRACTSRRARSTRRSRRPRSSRPAARASAPGRRSRRRSPPTAARPSPGPSPARATRRAARSRSSRAPRTAASAPPRPSPRARRASSSPAAPAPRRRWPGCSRRSTRSPSATPSTPRRARRPAARSAPTRRSPTPRVNGLWPSIAINSAGDAIAAWITNTDGSGGGAPAAAIHRS